MQNENHYLKKQLNIPKKTALIEDGFHSKHDLKLNDHHR